MKNANLLLFLFLFCSCGPTIYLANDFESQRKKIKNVAILPFSCSIDSKHLPKNLTIENLKQAELETGYSVQNNVYTWLLKRNQNYTVKFQDVDHTNALLKNANISYDDMALKEKGELCTLLDVDAVISGKVSMSKPMSDGASVALVALFGVYGSTNETNATLTIHNDTSELLWKYDYKASGSIGSSTERLTDALMKNASKKFPMANQ